MVMRVCLAYHGNMETTGTEHGLEAVREQISRALEHRNASISAEVVLDVLVEAVGASEPLTEGEQQFLIEHAEASRNDFTIEAQTLTTVEITTRQADADLRARSRVMTTSEVARFLGRAPSNVRRSLSAGNLYALGASTPGRERLFPEWQFMQDGRTLPGLRAVLASLPDDYHPLDVEEFMVGSQESLRGRSPAVWLAGGGTVETVVDIADELGWA